MQNLLSVAQQRELRTPKRLTLVQALLHGLNHEMRKSLVRERRYTSQEMLAWLATRHHDTSPVYSWEELYVAMQEMADELRRKDWVVRVLNSGEQLTLVICEPDDGV